ncbi:myocardin-related transcription factor B [Polymixia lowei]
MTVTNPCRSEHSEAFKKPSRCTTGSERCFTAVSEGLGGLAMEELLSDAGLMVPSPCSDAVARELKGLSLLPCPSLLPLRECKNVLQLRLQQRRTREQLAEQGIMPPLKTPAAFHEQIRNLERARTGNFLKHKICSRPERSELVRMHILQETQAEPSLQATQMKLKRARLADDLNEKISHRPGPMELVVKNILPVDTGVKEAIVEQVNCSKVLDVYNFDEDSSEAVSPEQPSSQLSQSSCTTSPKEAGGAEALSTSPQINSPMQLSQPPSQALSDLPNLASTNEQQSNHLAKAPQPITAVAMRGPVLVKQSQPKTPGDKSRSKKSKEPKPRVKKLKYHQYVPPDQKQEASEAPMDSAYARLLQQQQQFLQLQILNQQQQHYNYQAILPAPLKPGNEGQTICSTVALSGNVLSSPHAASLTTAGPVQPNQAPTNRTSEHLPANLDEMKVAELKMELKLRGLLVSGTKTDLIERLKLYQESSNVQPASAMEVTPGTGAPPTDSLKSTPPVSPAAPKLSGPGVEGTRSPAHAVPSGSSPLRAPQEESPAEARPSEKDKRLHEKERQIEELMRKLEREQRLVEELKMQLEVEKRGQQGDASPQPSPPAPVQVKEENGTSSDFSAACSSPGLSAVVKQEEVTDQSCLTPPHQFFISQQQLPQTPQAGQPRTHVLSPVSLPASAATVQLPDNSIKFQTTVSSAAPGLIQAPGLMPQKIEGSAALQLQCTSHPQPMTETGPPNTYPGSGSQFRAGQSPAMEDAAQPLLSTVLERGHPAAASRSQAAPQGPAHKPTMILQHPKFTNHVPKCKDPPRYEDAVKQTRSVQTAIQVPTATSQHMDDLFDVLIESGEIAPFIRQDPPCLDKLIPVTANVTTLPINTVLSRPPPQIQVAQPPAPTLDPASSLVALASDTQLETLLEGTLHRLEHPHSPMDTMELDFSDNTPPSAFHLQNTNLGNMEWLDLTIPVAEEVVNPLGMSSPVGVFSSDFLDSHELQLNWD